MLHIVLSTLFSLLFISASVHAQPLRVLTTTNLIADLAVSIGGPHVQVDSLMGPGVDPHIYRATQGDLRRLQEAEVVFYNGLHLEGKMHTVLEKLGLSRKVVAISSSIPTQNLRRPPEFEGGFDPHIWFDTKLWINAAQTVTSSLVQARPELRAEIEERAKNYVAELNKLDDWIRAEVSRIPAERRVLITAHDAFGYFGAAYGLEVIGLQGISTATEYGLQDVVRLVNLISSRSIPAFFVETSVSHKFVAAIRDGVSARGKNVTVGGELYSDALGGQGSPASTYLAMMRHNVSTIVGALQ